MLSELSIKAFHEQLAVETATPGGGSVAALHGATAASLIMMVARLSFVPETAWTEKFHEHCKMAAVLREKFYAAIDGDARAFDAVMAAYKMPKVKDSDKKQRLQMIQEGLKNAVLIPLEVARDALTLMQMAEILIENGNQNALSDSKVAMLSAHAALRGALYNVQINLIAITDLDFCKVQSDVSTRLTAGALKIVSVCLDESAGTA